MSAFEEMAEMIHDNAIMNQQIDALKRMIEKAQIDEAKLCKSLKTQKDNYFPKLYIDDLLNVFGWEASAEAAMIMQSYEPKEKKQEAVFVNLKEDNNDTV